MNVLNCSRRDFVKATGLTFSGLFLGFRLDGQVITSKGEFEPNAYIAIDKNAGIVLTIAVPEIGQNIRTTFAMILADELGADIDNVTLHQSPPNPKIGMQNTGGSNSVRRQYQPMRQAAAAAARSYC